MSYIEEYYEWILKNPNKVCKKVKIAYERLVEDSKKSKQVSFYNKTTDEIETHTYVFDLELAQRPIKFIEKFCKHSKGKWAGKPVVLELWQKAFIEATFGFVDNKTKLRKYRKVALFVARKNGKSTLAAALGLYLLLKDGEGGAEVYSVATKRDQAKVVWNEAKKMIKKSPALSKRCRTLVTGIYYDKTDSIFNASASESNSLDGFNASGILADEIHAWKDQNLLDVMEDSQSSREQPLLIETSTMGKIRESVFDNEYSYFSNILQQTVTDETVLPIIYELDDQKEWQDEEAWIKANPALGTIKNLSTLRNKVEKAKNKPDSLSNLLCKDFNIRQNEEEKWLSFDVIDNNLTFEIKELKGTYAIGGADLSSTTDLTCATLVVFKNKIKYVLQQYFIPSERLEFKINDDKIPYDIWKERGLVTTCDGAKVNYNDVTEWFVKMHQQFDISALYVGYDPWNAAYWVEEMKEKGFEMIEVRQGAKTMSNPMKQLEADLIEKKVNYNQNSILKWCLLNTAIKSDENDNIRPIKGKKQRSRIDGTVSLIIAYCVLHEKMQDYLALQED